MPLNRNTPLRTPSSKRTLKTGKRKLKNPRQAVAGSAETTESVNAVPVKTIALACVLGVMIPMSFFGYLIATRRALREARNGAQAVIQEAKEFAEDVEMVQKTLGYKAEEILNTNYSERIAPILTERAKIEADAVEALSNAAFLPAERNSRMTELRAFGVSVANACNLCRDNEAGMLSKLAELDSLTKPIDKRVEAVKVVAEHWKELAEKARSRDSENAVKDGLELAAERKAEAEALMQELEKDRQELQKFLDGLKSFKEFEDNALAAQGKLRDYLTSTTDRLGERKAEIAGIHKRIDEYFNHWADGHIEIPLKQDDADLSPGDLAEFNVSLQLTCPFDSVTLFADPPGNVWQVRRLETEIARFSIQENRLKFAWQVSRETVGDLVGAVLLSTLEISLNHQDLPEPRSKSFSLLKPMELRPISLKFSKTGDFHSGDAKRKFEVPRVDAKYQPRVDLGIPGGDSQPYLVGENSNRARQDSQVHDHRPRLVTRIENLDVNAREGYESRVLHLESRYPQPNESEEQRAGLDELIEWAATADEQTQVALGRAHQQWKQLDKTIHYTLYLVFSNDSGEEKSVVIARSRRN